MEAEMTLEYDDAKVAEAVAKAVWPDNFKTPNGLLVETKWNKETVLAKIVCKGKLPTFIATIDDLLFCISTAEKAVHAAKRFE